ncbi:Phytocyanin domain [Sesbania bispinosa]|nr:Phytocyanin domain [Sesbania bispinosa]
MEKGRGMSASMVVMVLLALMILFHSKMVHSYTYAVGDAGGWTYNVDRWPIGKSFRAGDALQFTYIPFTHNVVVVDEIGYNNCNPLRGTRVYGSGSDIIQLSPGMNYFICGFLVTAWVG